MLFTKTFTYIKKLKSFKHDSELKKLKACPLGHAFKLKPWPDLTPKYVSIKNKF